MLQLHTVERNLIILIEDFRSIDHIPYAFGAVFWTPQMEERGGEKTETNGHETFLRSFNVHLSPTLALSDLVRAAQEALDLIH